MRKNLFKVFTGSVIIDLPTPSPNGEIKTIQEKIMDIIFGVVIMYFVSILLCLWAFAAAGGEFTFE